MSGLLAESRQGYWDLNETAKGLGGLWFGVEK